MLDVRATAYIVPVAEQPQAGILPVIHVDNLGDEDATVHGYVRIYNTATGLLLHTSALVTTSLLHATSADITAMTTWDPPAPADQVYQITADITAVSTIPPFWHSCTSSLPAMLFDVKAVPAGPIPGGHHATHEAGGIDEPDLTGMQGVLANPQTPELHAVSHQSGQADELNVAGLFGELADPQPPKAHGNADHTTTFEDQANKGVAGGYCGLPNPLDPTLPLRADGTPAHTSSMKETTDFLPGGSISGWPWTSSATGGTCAAIAAPAGHPGVQRISSAAGANTGFRYFIYQSALLISGGEHTEAIIRPGTLANSIIRFGFHDSTTSAAPTDGAYLEMNTVGGVPGTLSGVTSAGGISTATATSFVLVTNTWYRLALTVNAAASLVTFFLYDAANALLWSDTTNANIPTAPGNETGHAIVATSSGTVTVVDLDWMTFTSTTQLPGRP